MSEARPHHRLTVPASDDALRSLRAHALQSGDSMAESLGFLGTIDAGNVRLNRAALDDMMSCLRALGPTLSVGRVVERETISLLWTIVSFSRVWSATDFEGRLDVRARWSPQEATALQRRVDAISYAVMIFIDTNDEDEAFAEYNCLVEQE